jgi:hypothetical protein
MPLNVRMLSIWTRMPSVYRTRTAFSCPESNCGKTAAATAEKFASDQAATRNCADMILRIFLGGVLTVSVLHAQSPSPDNRDQAAFIALENEWLANLHNPAVLEKILASDFVHPLPTGDFVTKSRHIQFSATHLPSPNWKQRFDQMQVRVYGDVGIVNGIVLTTDEQGSRSGANNFH